MYKKFVFVFVISIILISGCTDKNSGLPEFSDRAIKMDFEVTEEQERSRILPGQTITFIVYLTNQVRDSISNVDIYISNPYGINISYKDCLDCAYTYENGAHFNEIISGDQVEVDFSLKIPGEEEISPLGQDLKPEMTLEYDYYGNSTLHIPIYKKGEMPPEEKKEDFTQTKGPIHVKIEGDKWARESGLIPIYVSVEDVLDSKNVILIEQDEFTMSVNQYISEVGGNAGDCDFTSVGSVYRLKDAILQPTDGNIELPLKNPYTCAVKAGSPVGPMANARININYDYRYKMINTKTIRVEKVLG